MRQLSTILICGFLSGCVNPFSPPPVIAPQVMAVSENDLHGTVNGAWEEPIFDQVEVPAQLDPNGVTYRPKHTTIVEIPAGRVQEVQYPDGSVKSPTAVESKSPWSR